MKIPEEAEDEYLVKFRERMAQMEEEELAAQQE